MKYPEEILRERIAKLEAENEWQPISTAPDDGTRFLAWCPNVGRVIMRIDGVRSETWALDPSGRFDCEPTHWMPLPPPPKTFAALAGKAEQ